MENQYPDWVIEEATKWIKAMRGNCVPKPTDTYNDPNRQKKHDALTVALYAIEQLSNKKPTDT